MSCCRFIVVSFGGSCGYGELFEGLTSVQWQLILLSGLKVKILYNTTRSQPVRTYDMCHIKKCCLPTDMRLKEKLSNQKKKSPVSWWFEALLFISTLPVRWNTFIWQILYMSLLCDPSSTHLQIRSLDHMKDVRYFIDIQIHEWNISMEYVCLSLSGHIYMHMNFLWHLEK